MNSEIINKTDKSVLYKFNETINDDIEDRLIGFHNAILNKLNDEEKKMYNATIETASELIEKNQKLEQALDEIDINLQNETLLVEEEIDKLRKIIKKAKEE